MHKTAKRVETRKLMRRKSLPKIHKTKLKGRKQVQEAVLNDRSKMVYRSTMQMQQG